MLLSGSKIELKYCHVRAIVSAIRKQATIELSAWGMYESTNRAIQVFISYIHY